jgi:hypothetical protein
VCFLRVLATAVLFAQAPTGVFEVELWPGEGRPLFQAVTNELVVRETPSRSANIVRRLLGWKGHEVAFDDSRYRTIESGLLQALSTTSVTGRVLGAIRRLTREAYYRGQFPRKTVSLKEGDVIEYLQYRAEGTCFVRVADQVIDADPCPTPDDRTLRAVTQPKTEWWIRLVLDGAPVGWVMVDENTVEQNGRSG